MAIDLTALDFAQSALSEAGKPAAKPDGKAVEFNIADIREDPGQPRREFDQAALEELAADIRQRGVSTPISLRSDPEAAGRYIINHGHRRYRASILVGKTTIPAHIAEAHDPYGQMTENMQREDMKPHEIAEFIKKRRALGESNSFIAKSLGKPPRYITEHLALVDMPEPLAAAYAAGKSTSPTTHYYLRNLYEKHPDQVATWVSDQLEITRKSVDDLANELGGKSDKAKPEATAPKTSDFVRTKSKPDRVARTEESSPVAKVNFRPLLLVEIDGRPASVQLKQLPSRRGLLRIRYENDAAEAEVEASRCTILSLEDGGKAIVPLVGADAEPARATG
ncbi:ParB/RepB/Spo0J family partition protein [Luteimonas gilva]|uniref:ParB/RepB/Spo0J family partition protein n=1 Tax=Luteimonas gilva TaxID=2572684 RepID=A0A4U5JLH7_9GAMM|nr:ParB/RepB/Spo0J family partition protein [Luteimonas gilva]TKR30452.1 ParB/RepB/Spo0J family partition protein [Luteimonas gilva]